MIRSHHSLEDPTHDARSLAPLLLRPRPTNADAPLGYGTLSSTGVWTFTWNTTGLTAGTYTLFAQAEDGYGAFGDPTSLTVN